MRQHPISSCNLIFSSWATPSPLCGCFGFSEWPFLLLLDNDGGGVDDGDDDRADDDDDPMFVFPE